MGRARVRGVMPVRDHHLRVALVHDDLTQRGGAERVVLSLHRLFPDAPMFTSVYAPEGTYPEFADCDIRTSPLQRLPGARRWSRAFLPLYPWAFGRLRLHGYDLVISSSSRFAHGVRVEGGTHVCYCYSPARFLYGDEYFGAGSPAPRWARPVLAPVLAAIRRWDRRAAVRPDLYVAISAETARRIERLYGLRARVVRPPVAAERFARSETDPLARLPYYLVVSRLLPYKRVDLAIRACRARGARLVVVGAGPAESTLRALAGPRVEFLSRVTDDELNHLLEGCLALIQPGVEDFGLMPLEVNAAGRPAVALAAGGALETVVDGVTGVLFDGPGVAALADALARADDTPWDAGRLRAHARAHAEDGFHREILQVLDDLGVFPASLARASAALGPA